MRRTALLALMVALVMVAANVARAEEKPMLGNIYGRVIVGGEYAEKAFVEFVIFDEKGVQHNFSTRTDDHGVYRIERVPFGKGYAKVLTADSRGPATEFVSVSNPETKLIFKL